MKATVERATLLKCNGVPWCLQALSEAPPCRTTPAGKRCRKSRASLQQAPLAHPTHAHLPLPSMTPSAASTGSPSFSYRPDVDGLRALAVLPVLLFHAGLGCSGGFVGVDVFFVISGYVISSLILREIAAGSFSMVQFWERRIRRIMPALTCMVVAVRGAAWLFCLPEDFQRVGKSVLAQAVMGANFYFWKDGNYFDPGAETKPLLHTWSLAVEEQFYLLFPLLLTFLVRSRPRTWQRWLWGIALGSLVIGIALSYSSHNQRAAFYLLPARAWELLIGVLVAVYRGRFSANKAAQEVSGFLGLALIGLAVLGFDGSTRFPAMPGSPQWGGCSRGGPSSSSGWCPTRSTSGTGPCSCLPSTSRPTSSPPPCASAFCWPASCSPCCLGS
ncbi:MAG: hypothetical protein B7Z23_13815 [Pseudomonadales bacterium 32-61-5]|nr:MAG: hypothetical protein B7Z23_13815 [Pseudomonadales bacterium 32-61-5]